MTDIADVPDASEPARENYAILMNVVSLVDFEQIELAPGHIVRQATDSEIEEIPTILKRVSGFHYETASAFVNENLSGDVPWTGDLRWPLYVIAFRGNNSMFGALQDACSLSRAEPEIGPIAMQGSIQGTLYNQSAQFQLLEEAPYNSNFLINLSGDDIEEISKIRQLLNDHDNALIDIKWTVRQLRNLRTLPYHSTLKFLGYFSVLESLLTHLPDPKDPYDSITRQVKKKLTLLNNRFIRKLDYSPFGNIEPEKLWVKLYKYRSKIAHGGRVQFTGDLAALGSHDQALYLLRQATKAVARQALLEPQLLLDLQEC